MSEGRSHGATGAPRPVAYVADRVWDGDGAMLERGAVVLDGDRIGSVGAASALSSDVPRIELGDATLLPGLIDAHVHLTWTGSAAPARLVAEEPSAWTLLRAVRHCSQHLTAGVTTVRDLGSAAALAVDLAGAAEAGLAVAPRIQAAGRAMAMTGGHGHFIAREVDGVDAVRLGVRSELKHGAACIKLMASGGVMGAAREQPESPQMTLAELRSAVEEAHRAGVKVAAHAFGVEAIRAALDAGVDTIEHGSLLDDETAALLAGHGVALVPTLSPMQALHERGRELGVAEHMLTKIAALHEAGHRAVRAATAAGVTLVAGTDAGVPGQPHGEIATEVALVHAAGATRRDALRAATSAAADALGLAQETGRLRPGLRADLLAVAGDPTEELGALRSPILVVRAGVELRRSGGAGAARGAEEGALGVV